MTHGVRKVLTGLIGAAVLLSAGAAFEARGQEPANRRILDVKMLSFEKKFRIVIHMDEISAYIVTPPRADRPLKIELANTDYDPALRPSPASNALVRKVNITPSESGLVTLTFELASAEVEVKDFSIENSLIMVDLKLRPGVELPAEPEKTPFAETKGPADEIPAFIPTPALPPTPAPSRDVGPGLPAPGAPRQGPALPPALPPAGPSLPGDVAEGPTGEDGGPEWPSTESLEEFDYYPYHTISLEFPGAQQLVEAYREKRYVEAHEMGVWALTVPQSQKSLDSLVYLVAECYYQLTKGFDLDAFLMPIPNWLAAQNYFQQAKRNAPESPARPFADYRISQIYSAMDDVLGQHTVLKRMAGNKELRTMPEVLFYLGESSRALFYINRLDRGYLDVAQKAYEDFMEEYPGHPLWHRVKLNLGEIFYQKGDNDELAYETMREALANQKIGPTDIHAHQAFLAHKLGLADVVNPRNRADRLFREYIDASQNPEIHLEFARMLKEAGERKAAMRYYNRIVEGLTAIVPTPQQVEEAKLAMARFAMEDYKTGGLDPAIPWDAYLDPLNTLKEMQDEAFDFFHAADLAREATRLMVAMGKNSDAVDLAIQFLNAENLPEEHAREFGRMVWDILPAAIEYLHDQGDPFLVLHAYQSLSPYLKDHPRHNETLLSIAQIMMDAGWRDRAYEALEQMDDYADLPAEMKDAVSILQREMRLDPSNPELVKRSAPRLLTEETNDRTRARVLKMLGKVYSGEGDHLYAAREVYMRGPDLDELPWEDRTEFFLLAGAEYEAAMLYSEALKVYYQCLRAIEEEGVEPEDAHDRVGKTYMAMGADFQRIRSHDQAVKAYQKYLEYYPKGVHAHSARFFLGQSHAAAGDVAKALEQYNLLRTEASQDPFWKNVAEMTMRQLKWEEKYGNVPSVTAAEDQISFSAN